MLNYVICPICNKHLKDMGYHINKMHNINGHEFKQLYPNSPLISESLSRKRGESISMNRKEHPRDVSPETRAKISIKSKEMHAKMKKENHSDYMKRQQDSAEKARNAKGLEYKHSESTILKMKEAAKTRPPRKPHTDQTKQLISDVQKKRKRWHHTEETKQKIKDGFNRFKQTPEYEEWRLNNSIRTKELYEREPERKAKLVKSKQDKFTSSLEIKFQKFLNKNQVRFSHQYILDVWVYDFFLLDMNMLVEIDGEYWHTKSLEQINKDVLKHNCAIKNNFNICRISDKDWSMEKIFLDKEFLNSDSISIVSDRKINFKAKDTSQFP